MLNDFVHGRAAGRSGGRRPGSLAYAGDAMRRIAGSGVRFLSRGDQSGTHEREEALWQGGGTAKAFGDGRQVVAGAAMGATLRIASVTEGYSLSDRATFLRLVRLVAARRFVHEGDAAAAEHVRR